jgi:hypothetical protein
MRRRNKYNAVQVKDGDRTFPSKKHAAYHFSLERAKKEGRLLGFCSEVPFLLACGTVWIADYVESWADGTERVVDVKGVRTGVYKIKKRMIEHEYPFRVVEV